MRLVENMHAAERKGLANVRRQMNRAKEEWSDVERRIRQKMRVYPQKLRSRIDAGHEPATDRGNLDAMKAAAAAAHGSKPPVSIDGGDVPKHDRQDDGVKGFWYKP